MVFGRKKGQALEQKSIEGKNGVIEIEDKGIPFMVLYSDGDPRMYNLDEYAAIALLENELSYFRAWRDREFQKILETREKRLAEEAK